MNTEAIKTVAPTKRREWYRWARQVMARVADGANGFLLRAIALGACAIIVGILGWALSTLMNSTQANANRLTAIETTLVIMQKDIERMANGD